jgi:hypothetical protein
MARYTGPKTELLVTFEAIFGDDKAFERKLPTWTTRMAKKRKRICYPVNGEAES